mmetsp:Transcript_85489/g.276862  ORF Transcript_85489/g.276862 Transcript_85489/m.276862 type:complete len:380 (-) Transcript_85489:2-1141(-)
MLCNLDVRLEGVAVLPHTGGPEAVAPGLHRVGQIAVLRAADDGPTIRVDAAASLSVRVVLREMCVDLPTQGYGNLKASPGTRSCDKVGRGLLEAGIMPAHAGGAFQQVLATLEVLAAQEEELPIVRHRPQALLQQALTEVRVKCAIVFDHKKGLQLSLPAVSAHNVLPDEEMGQGAPNCTGCKVKTKQLVAVRQHVPLPGQVGDEPCLRQLLHVHLAPVNSWEARGAHAEALKLPQHEGPTFRTAVQVDAVDALEELVPTPLRARSGLREHARCPTVRPRVEGTSPCAAGSMRCHSHAGHQACSATRQPHAALGCRPGPAAHCRRPGPCNTPCWDPGFGWCCNNWDAGRPRAAARTARCRRPHRHAPGPARHPRARGDP